MVEDGRVAEVYLERPERRSIAGNIYLGVVDNVLPGMEAAFVEIGLEKNGFLYVDEIVVPELEGKRHGKKIQDLISRGEQLLVQAVKDPMKTKGARLTTEISLPGRFVVYVPNGEGLGVSRRLEDAERSRLKDIIKALDVKEGGVIVRTAAEGASAEDVERDLVFLQRLWKTIQARAKASSAPALVYQEAELPLRIVRDLFAGDFLGAQVDNERTHKRIVSYLKKTSPHMIERVHRYREKEPLFESSGVEKEIASTLDRRVDLPSGGYLVFDYAEAFTVIDVNTGRFVGSRSKNSSQRLEDTITKNNLEAVKEVVRQLRLRDIGGIIVIDFIDMANPKNRASVEDALRQELERDRTKTYVVEISPLGLVEMTRQNVTDGPREILTRKCPTCAGDGIVVSDSHRGHAGRAPAALARCAREPRPGLPRRAAPPGARARRRAGRRPARCDRGSDAGVASSSCRPRATSMRIISRSSPRASSSTCSRTTPLTAGATLELKLGEVGRYDATAAAGRVDGFEVLVAGAAKLVGKKATVTIGHVLEGQAFATLVASAEQGAGPITFESEAEKPTRAPGRRKPATTTVEDDELAEEVAPDADADGTEEPLVEDVAGEEPEDAGEKPDLPEGDGAAPAKKRTRRGSRGGRRRRKGTAAERTCRKRPARGRGGRNGRGGRRVVRERRRRGGAEAGAAGGGAPRIHVPVEPDGAPPAAEVVHEAVLDEPEESMVDGSADAVEPSGEAGGAEDGEGSAAPKKKTRRGTRGGRSRRKKTAVASGRSGGRG